MTVFRDRKGQSLVLFVLLIPLIIGVVILVYDVGNAMVEKNKMNNIIEMVMEMSLEDELETSKIESLLSKNLNGYNNEVHDVNNKMVISSSTNIEGVFSKLFGFQGFEIRSEYVGEVINKEIVITKKR